MPVIVPRKWSDMQRDFAAECTRLAELAWRLYCRNPYQLLYLTGRKKAGLDTRSPLQAIWCELTVESGAAEGWSIVSNERLSCAATVEVLADCIRQILNHHPLWIFAD